MGSHREPRRVPARTRRHGTSSRRLRARVRAAGRDRHKDLRPGPREELQGGPDVLRTARRDPRSVTQCEPDPAGEAARDDLRKEGIYAHDARSGIDTAETPKGAGFSLPG